MHTESSIAAESPPTPPPPTPQARSRMAMEKNKQQATILKGEYQANCIYDGLKCT